MLSLLLYAVVNERVLRVVVFALLCECVVVLRVSECWR